jgi:hypothetical protein
MTTDLSTSERVLGAARALFQERKVLSIEEIRNYLKNVAQVHVSESEVELILSRWLCGQADNLPAVALHQAFLFKRSARGFWRGQYSVLVLERVYGLDSSENQKSGRVLYLVYGIADDGEATAKFLGAAVSPEVVLKHLQQSGLEITGWFPLSAEQSKALLTPTTEDLKGLVDQFGKSLFSADGTEKCSFVRAC